MLNGLGAVAFQVGANASQTISITLADFQTANGDEATGPLGDVDVDGDGDLTDSTSGVASLDLTTASNHTAALHGLASAIDNVNSQRATIGSVINRLEYAVDNLANVSRILLLHEAGYWMRIMHQRQLSWLELKLFSKLQQRCCLRLTKQLNQY